jgi:hypothetical protein
VSETPNPSDDVDQSAIEEYWRAGFAILLEESRRAIDNQLRELSDLRSRAGNLIGYAGLALSIVLATNRRPAPAPAGLAGLTLLAVIGCALWIQRPVKLRIELGGADLATQIRQAGTPSAAMEVVAGFHIENFNENSALLKPLQWVYFSGLAAFTLELGALALVVL